MISRLPKLLVAIALAGSIGLHWAFFQSVAWVGMVIAYSQQAPLTEALTKTFDGKHPCSLCNKIAQAQRSQHKPDRLFEGKKLECVNVRQVFAFSTTNHFHLQSSGNDLLPSICYSPPVPPPRYA